MRRRRGEDPQLGLFGEPPPGAEKAPPARPAVPASPVPSGPPPRAASGRPEAPAAAELANRVLRACEKAREKGIRLRPRAWGIGRSGKHWAKTEDCLCPLSAFLVVEKISTEPGNSPRQDVAVAAGVDVRRVSAFLSGVDGRDPPEEDDLGVWHAAGAGVAGALGF